MMTTKKIFLFVASILIFGNVRGQLDYFQLIDDIQGGYSQIGEILLDPSGQRHYYLKKVKDSLIVNGVTIPVPDAATPADYALVVNDNEVVSLTKRQADGLVLRNNAQWLLTSFQEDTLWQADTFFVNRANGAGSNLLAQGISLTTTSSGESYKHWTSPFDCRYTIEGFDIYRNQLHFNGIYSGNQGGLLLDQQFLPIGSGNGNAFIGAMSPQLEVQWLNSVSGLGSTVKTRMAVNPYTGNLLLAGSSQSSVVYFCGDSLVNPGTSPNQWGSSFMYLIEFDQDGNCLHKQTLEYDFGEVIPNQVIHHQGRFLISGTYNSSYLQWKDWWRAENPNRDQTDFILQIDRDSIFPREYLFQLGGSPGTKSIQSMTIDEQSNLIWICGYSEADTLILNHSKTLTSPTGSGPFGFWAILDHYYRIRAFAVFPHLGRRVMFADDQIYLLQNMDFAANHHQLLRADFLMDTEELNAPPTPSLRLHVYPNPLGPNRQLQYSLSGNNLRQEATLRLFDHTGRLLNQQVIQDTSGSLSLPDPPGIYWLQYQSAQGQISQRVIAH